MLLRLRTLALTAGYISLVTLVAGNALAQGKGGAKASAKKSLSILDLQSFQTTEAQTSAKEGELEGEAKLINLNQNVGAWFLLKVRWPDSRREYVFHLENPEPLEQKVTMPPTAGAGLRVTSSKAGEQACDIWSKDAREDLKKSLLSRNAFTPICGGKLYVRHKIDGRKTTKEWVVEFLRDNIWGGEKITTFVKEKLLKDSFLIKSRVSDASNAGAGDDANAANKPWPASIEPKYETQLVDPVDLGLSVAFEDGRKMKVGRWYEHQKAPGVFVSVVVPDKIKSDIMESYIDLVGKLDNVESNATVYLVAFDLSRFDLGFMLGTDHPRLDWASRALRDSVDRSMPGPDGIGDWDPLVTTGMVNPLNARKVVATFTGGFKRDHGAFKWGKLASINGASHYGFVENGVVFSRLNPFLSTVAIMSDGTVELKTWRDEDQARLGMVRHARQNGVPIIDFDEKTSTSMPGDLLRNWGGGNWSGSEDSKFRTLRAGACLQQQNDHKYLVYGYFSSVTPSAMARVFQAYGCRYAMHLDMNALEHTYLAVYSESDGNMSIEHLISGMKVLDKSFQKRDIPRFIGFPDNRDFFYLTPKKQ